MAPKEDVVAASGEPTRVGGGGAGAGPNTDDAGAGPNTGAGPGPNTGAGPNTDGAGAVANTDDAAGAGVKGDVVADAGEPKRTPPAGGAPKGEEEATKGGAVADAGEPKRPPRPAAGAPPKAIGALATAPAASGTIEGISAILSALGAKRPVGRGMQPSLPQPVGGGLSPVEAAEYSMLGGWFERLEAIHHLPSRRVIVLVTCTLPEATLGQPTLM